MKEYKELKDIIIFGSYVKEKIEPKGIDIALLMSKTDLKVIESIKRKIDSLIKGLKVDYSVVSVEEIYNSIWLVLLKEGYSIRKNKFLYEIYNVKPLVMYKYNLKSLTNVQKVQFSRGLNRTLKVSGV